MNSMEIEHPGRMDLPFNLEMIVTFDDTETIFELKDIHPKCASQTERPD